jgi:hypothetical protein
MLRVDHVPPPRRAQPPARHDPYAYRGSQSPYQAALDRNGWFLGWEDRNGNPLPSRGRYGPPRPPSPYHRPVVDQNGWFLHWEDMSGDVSTRNAEARERRYDSD